MIFFFTVRLTESASRMDMQSYPLEDDETCSGGIFQLQAESWNLPYYLSRRILFRKRRGGLGSFWAANCGGVPRLSNFGLPIVAGVPGLGNFIM